MKDTTTRPQPVTTRAVRGGGWLGSYGGDDSTCDISRASTPDISRRRPSTISPEATTSASTPVHRNSIPARRFTTGDSSNSLSPACTADHADGVN